MEADETARTLASPTASPEPDPACGVCQKPLNCAKVARVAAELCKEMEVLIQQSRIASRKRPRPDDSPVAMRLSSLPDEVLSHVATILLESNYLHTALQYASALSKVLHLRLAGVRPLTEALRLRWCTELARKVRTVPGGGVLEVGSADAGRRVLALESATVIAGNELPTTGVAMWTTVVERCRRGVVRVGVANAWPSSEGHAWGVNPRMAVLQRFGWDGAGRLDFTPPPTGGFPDRHGTPFKAAWLDPSEFADDNDVALKIRCILDCDAGTLTFAYEHCYCSGDPRLLRDSLESSRTSALGGGCTLITGLPRVSLRPWVYLSNPGDSARFAHNYVFTWPSRVAYDEQVWGGMLRARRCRRHWVEEMQLGRSLL